MSQKKKTDIMKIFAGAAFGAASVIFVWVITQPRFQSIPVVLLLTAVVAFLTEVAVLQLLKGKNPFLRAIKILLVLSINVSFFTCGVIYSFAPAIILQPHSDESSISELEKTTEAEEINIKGKNGNICGWFYNTSGENAPVVLFFYGNYETAASRLLHMIKEPFGKAFDGYNIAVFDYPAYGKSEGRCTDESICDFAVDVYDFLSQKSDSITVAGYSVGTGPAVYTAREREAESLILYAPFYNGADLYNNVIDIFHGPLERLIAFNIENGKNALSVDERTLIFASETDKVIPFTSSIALKECFADCSFLTAPVEGHNDFFNSEFVTTKTKDFINKEADYEK